MDDADLPGYDPGTASHGALRVLRGELERHLAIVEAQGFPPATHANVVARLDGRHFGRDVSEATLTVRWFAGETPEDPPEFSFHYTDDTGADFGWHHEPNPHVDGWGHFQERDSPDAEYAYSPYRFESTVAPRVVWKAMSELSARLEASG